MCILFNNLLFRSQLSHSRDCRGSSNPCLAFTVPVKGFWLTAVETQTFPWQVLHAGDCWEGQTFHSGIVPLPREQTRPGADCSSWGHPMALTFPGAAGEVFAAAGRAASAGVLQAMLDRKGHTKAKMLCKLLLVREQALVS